MTKTIQQRSLAALRSEPRIGPRFKPVVLEYNGTGTLTIEGEVESLCGEEAWIRAPRRTGRSDRNHRSVAGQACNQNGRCRNPGASPTNLL